MNKNQKTLRIAIIAQAVLMLIILPNVYFLMVKFGGYWAASTILLEWMFFIGLFVMLILLIIRTIKYQQWHHKSNYFTLAIALVFLCMYILRFNIGNGGIFQSKLKITARYDNSIAVFRENGKFEAFSLESWYVHYSEGTYTQKSDSLFLNFTQLDVDQDEKFLLGDTLIIRDSILYKVQNDILVSTHYRILDGKKPK